jgi:hypothetical protein
MRPRQKLLVVLALAAFCGVSLVAKENYPLSHYPMYADPGSTSEYFYLAGSSGDPLPVRTLTGVTSSQLGKILRKRGDDRARDLGVHRRELPAAEWGPICQQTLDELRARATAHGKVVPEALRLVHATIELRDGEVVESPVTFYSE